MTASAAPMAASVVASSLGLTVVAALLVLLRPRTRARPPVPPTADHRIRAPRPRLPGSSARRDRALDRSMPDLLDLLVVALQAGLPAPAAFATVAPHVHPEVARAIAEVEARLANGDRFVDALDALVDHLGTRALALVAAIAAAERWGLPLAPTVDRIADDARHHRRRLAEIEARRLPVRLSVPLVCCTLPSFVCIAIGPLVIGALASLRAV